jgi:acyl CoA:acetate/3-ketoacid CoA transferase
MVGRLASTK